MKLIAHRGGRGFGLDNTIDAMRNAVNQGVKAIETDVRITGDGNLIICHDALVWGHAVKRAPYDEILKYTPERPKLLEVLENFSGWVELDLEIKDAPVAELGEMLRSYNMQGSVLVTSFNQDFLESFKIEYPEFRTGFLYRLFYGDDQKLHNAVAAGVDIVLPYYQSISQELIDHARRHDLEICAWTVNREEDLEKLFNWGIDYVITDRYIPLKERLDTWQAEKKD